MLVLLSVGACMIVPARMFQCSVPAESRAGRCSLQRLTGPDPLKPEERTAHSGPLPRELSTVPLGLGEHHPGKDRLDRSFVRFCFGYVLRNDSAALPAATEGLTDVYTYHSAH